MYGVGMVVGALAATRVMRRLAFGTVIGLGPVTGFVAAAVMALTTIVPTPWLAGLSFFLLGVGPILWVISTTTLRQSVTPPSLLGRVSAINIMSYGARPLGSALGAIVGGLYGAEACLYLAAAIFGAQALVILMSPAVSLARQPDMVGEPARCCGRAESGAIVIASVAKQSILSLRGTDGLLRYARNDGVSACFVPNVHRGQLFASPSRFI